MHFIVYKNECCPPTGTFFRMWLTYPAVFETAGLVP